MLIKSSTVGSDGNSSVGSSMDIHAGNVDCDCNNNSYSLSEQ
jgi:hypothetical protein